MVPVNVWAAYLATSNQIVANEAKTKAVEVAYEEQKGVNQLKLKAKQISEDSCNRLNGQLQTAMWNKRAALDQENAALQLKQLAIKNKYTLPEAPKPANKKKSPG